MATLTSTLTLACTDLFSTPVNTTSAPALAVSGLAGNIQRVATNDNPQALGAGVLIAASTAQEIATPKQIFVYVKHTGLESDGDTAAEASDTVRVTNAAGVVTGINILLKPNEFAFFPLQAGTHISTTGLGGGLAVDAIATECMIEFSYFTAT